MVCPSTMRLQNGLPKYNEIAKWFPKGYFHPIQNARVWYAIMVLQTIPIMNRFMPGLSYSLFLKQFDNYGKKVGCIIEWKKI